MDQTLNLREDRSRDKPFFYSTYKSNEAENPSLASPAKVMGLRVRNDGYNIAYTDGVILDPNQMRSHYSRRKSSDERWQQGVYYINSRNQVTRLIHSRLSVTLNRALSFPEYVTLIPICRPVICKIVMRWFLLETFGSSSPRYYLARGPNKRLWGDQNFIMRLIRVNYKHFEERCTHQYHTSSPMHWSIAVRLAAFATKVRVW